MVNAAGQRRNFSADLSRLALNADNFNRMVFATI
jgi:hypothetical protein